VKYPKKSLVLLALGALSIVGLGEVSPVFTVGFWRLAYAQEFVMFAGTDNPYSQITEAKLFLRVLGSANPEDSFLMLYRVGNRQGKAFALFGLHELGSPKLQEKLVEFARLDGSVHARATMCLHWDSPPATIVEEIRGWKELVTTSLLEHAKEAEREKSQKPNSSPQPTTAPAPGRG